MHTSPHENLAKLLSPAVRRFYGAMTVSMLLLILTGAVAIPFYFESPSILYKFGVDRIFLRSGQIIGLIAACLVILQFTLSARFKFLDRIFALNNLMNVHRISGMIIAGCAVIHPALIFLPDGVSTIPLNLRYWPEYAGVFLLLMIIGIGIIAISRSRIHLAFHQWRIMHQWATVITAITLFVHVLYVSESFESGPPRVIIFVTMGYFALVFSRARLKPFFVRRNPFTVSSVIQAAEDAFRIEIRPNSRGTPAYLPGQFGFVSIKSVKLSSEAHPFTIASSPSRSGSLEFAIRVGGDWTEKIGQVQPQDRFFVEGPFGLFTHLRCTNDKDIIMIAGGIGITPMLSMLRFMADTGDLRKITLIWSNRTRERIIFVDEFREFEKKLPSLQVIHIITEDPKGQEENKPLDHARLEKMLSGCSRESAVFVCGPPRMMKDIRKALIRIGFSRRNLFTERFSL